MIAFLTVYQYLSHLSVITLRFQSSILDTIKAYQHVDDVKHFYKELRKNFEVDFHKVYQQAEGMATAANVNPSKPRFYICQRNRPNAQAETVGEWYTVNVAVPFLDHIIAELDSQFSVLAHTSSNLLGLVLSVMCLKKIWICQKQCSYTVMTTSPEQFDQEFARWQHMYMSKDADKRPTSCAKLSKSLTVTSCPTYLYFLDSVHTSCYFLRV